MNIGSLNSSMPSMSDMQAMMAKRGGKPPEMPEDMKGLDPNSSDFTSKLADRMMSRMDTDGDGSITSTEAKLPDGMFEKLDSSGKGSLSKDDLIKGLDTVHAQMQTMMQQNGSFMNTVQDGGASMSKGLKAYQDQMASGLMDTLFSKKSELSTQAA